MFKRKRKDNTATFICSHVFNKTHPILYINKEDGDWQFLCGNIHDENEKPKLVCLKDIITRDNTINDILDLPDDWEAERKSIHDKFIRKPLYTQMCGNEFGKFVDSCYADLEKLQNNFQKKYKAGIYSSYWYDTEKEIFQFQNNDRVELEFNFCGIGTFNTKKKTWMWDWANESVPEKLREKSEKIKELFYSTGNKIFKTPYFKADETMAWELTAIACKILKAIAVYRVPHDDLLIFMALFEK